MKNSNDRTPPKGIFPADAQKGSGMPHDMGGHSGDPVKVEPAKDFHTRDNQVGNVVVGKRK